MFPIFKDKLYVIDIEVKPLPEFDKKKYQKDVESNEVTDEIHVDTPNFYPWCSEIYGLSLAWGPDYNTESIYFQKHDIEQVISILSKEKLKLGAHNIFFDWCNLYYKFCLPLNFVVDSGVISQAINNSDYITSFGLKQTTQRMYNIETQDFEIKDYLKDNFKIPESKYGEFIHLCPVELIEKYCRLDSHYCWRLIHDSVKWIKSDISLYMQLYVSEVKLTIQQFIEGISINKKGFEIEKDRLKSEVNAIEDKFLNHSDLIEYINKVQISKFNKAQSKLKKKQLDFEEWSLSPKNRFNINSTDQLKQLFDLQGLYFDNKLEKFIYPYLNVIPGTKINNPNSPKLGTKFLHAYGLGGEILADKGEKVTLSQHIERALEEAELTGSIHPHINLLGTRTGRISASGVNIIATPISESSYGKNLIIEDGWVLVVRDVKSLEPTLLACLSNDPVLRYSTYEGEGKEPFIKDDILWIDDNYIMAAYSAPFMRKEMMPVSELELKAIPFEEQYKYTTETRLNLANWVKNSDVEKKKIKQIRNLSKSIVLSTNYGAGPLKVQSKIREDLKITIPLKNIIEFQENYWATFNIASQYKRKLETIAQRDGYFINIGGYPLTFFEKINNGIISGSHKALNKMLQSSAAVVMKLLLHYTYQRIKNRFDIIPQVCDWHDAMFFKVHNETVNEFISLTDAALDDVNKTLNLPLKLRLDFNKGSCFYDCK